MISVEQSQVLNICFQYSIGRLSALPPRKLAYYTTAETALKIIQSQTFWLRNPKLMNDYQEVVHGTDCLRKALTGDDTIALATSTIDNVFSGVFKEIRAKWEERINEYQSSRAFIACLSEIGPTDDQGALSMWRAYGGSNGVAMVLRSEILAADTSFLNTFHSPVLYGAVQDIKDEIAKILTDLSHSKDALVAAGREFLVDRMVLALEFAMLSIKHVGFKEEREWRMIHRWEGPNDHLSYEGRVIRGNAEVVCEVDLASDPLLSPASLFEKVIVGPCLFPDNTAEAIRCSFANQNLSAPKIVRSDIPLRHM